MSDQHSSFPSENNRGQRRAILIGGVVLLFLALLLVVFGSHLMGVTSITEQDAVIPSNGPPLDVGDAAYDFALSSLDGATVRLSQFAGRPVIVNFWATWCAPCRIEMPALQAAYEVHQDEGLVILALNQDESTESVRTFFYQDFNFTFLPLLDKDIRTAETYGVATTLPVTFFIDPDGKITAVHRGPMTQAQIEAYLSKTISN